MIHVFRPIYILAVMILGVFCIAHQMPIAGGWIVAFALLGFLMSGGK